MLSGTETGWASLKQMGMSFSYFIKPLLAKLSLASGVPQRALLCACVKIPALYKPKPGLAAVWEPCCVLSVCFLDAQAPPSFSFPSTLFSLNLFFWICFAFSPDFYLEGEGKNTFTGDRRTVNIDWATTEKKGALLRGITARSDSPKWNWYWDLFENVPCENGDGLATQQSCWRVFIVKSENRV